MQTGEKLKEWGNNGGFVIAVGDMLLLWFGKLFILYRQYKQLILLKGQLMLIKGVSVSLPLGFLLLQYHDKLFFLISKGLIREHLFAAVIT